MKKSGKLVALLRKRGILRSWLAENEKEVISIRACGMELVVVDMISGEQVVSFRKLGGFDEHLFRAKFFVPKKMAEKILRCKPVVLFKR